MSATKQFLAPRDVKNHADACALSESIFETRTHWMHIQHDGAVVFAEQKRGGPCVKSMTIPRGVFLRMVEWYTTEQTRTTQP